MSCKLNSNNSDSTKNNNRKENEEEEDNRVNESEFNTNRHEQKKDSRFDTNEKKTATADPRFSRLLWYLIASTRGGINRAKIIDYLTETPSNANQLSNQLRLDYKTIIHHLEVLKKNGLVVAENQESYGATYFISPLTEKNYSAFEEIMAKFGKK